MILLLLILMLSASPSWASPIVDEATIQPMLMNLDLLYADRQSFDLNGEPQVTVGILNGAKRIVISSDGVLELLGGLERIEVPAGQEIEITILQANGGQYRYWVQLERFGAQNMDRASDVLAFARLKAPDARIFEAGALIGFAGYSFDTRSYTLVTGQSKTKAEAERRSMKRFGDKTHLYRETVEHPNGLLNVRSASDNLQLTVQDLLTVRALDPLALIKLQADKRDARFDRGDLLFLIGADKKLTVVNQLSAELLIAGVVPSEIYPDAPIEALKAQAVAARGLLMSKIGTRHRGEPYTLCATAHCQVYNGQTNINEQTERAVRETRGEVVFQKSGPTNTVYHSSCGGHLESSLNLWKIADSALQAVPDGGLGVNVGVSMLLAQKKGAHCAKSGLRFGDYRWQKTIPAVQVTKAVNESKPKGQPMISAVIRIDVQHRTSSGRVDRVSYVGPEGQVVIEGQAVNQKILGRLKSALWQVQHQGAQFVIQGGGFGHGVGLCQHGAIGMAEAGYNYRQILSHYYQNTTLKKLW